jgi:hypothetical protein
MVAQVDLAYARARPTKLVSRLISYALFEGRPLTTRGRWVNPLVKAQFRLAAMLPRLKRVERPIFVVGTGRSGTTVLGIVLSLHREVGFLNEPKLLWHCLHGGEDVIGSYTDAAARVTLDAADATGDVVERAHRLFGFYLRCTGSRRLLDKYPELIFRTDFVRAIFPDALFLFLVRDGFGTCASISRWSARYGVAADGATEDWWGREDRKWRCYVEQEVGEVAGWDPVEVARLTAQSDRAAVEWVLAMRAGLALEARDPLGTLRVRYEDLVDDPAAALDRISRFCGLAPDATMLDYARRTLANDPKAVRFDLHPAVRTVFDETMRALGY